MKPAYLLLAAAAALGVPRGATAQDDLKSASAARLSFVQVDSLALVFGVDTEAVRRHMTGRLATGRITVVADEQAPPLGVTILVRVPAEPETDNFVTVALSYGAPKAEGNGRASAIWDGQSPPLRAKELRMLPALVTVAADKVVDQLIAARDHARGRGSAP